MKLTLKILIWLITAPLVIPMLLLLFSWGLARSFYNLLVGTIWS